MGAEADDKGELITDPVDGVAEVLTETVAVDAPGDTRRNFGKRFTAWLGLAMAAPAVLASHGCAVGKLVGRYGGNLNGKENVFFSRLCETFLDTKKLMESILESYESLSIDEIEEKLFEYQDAVREMAMLEGRYKALRTEVRSDAVYNAVVQMETDEIVPLLERFQALQNNVRDGRAEKHEKRLLKLTDDTWMAEIMQGAPILIMASADWCPPCKDVMPVVAEYASSRGQEIRVRIAKLEDEGKEILMPDFNEMLVQNGVEPGGYPAFYLFAEGNNLIAYIEGAFSDARGIEKFVQRGLEKYRKQRGARKGPMNGQDSI